MKTFLKKTLLAFTLIEMMMSVGCGSLILAAVVSAGVALQRSFAAVEGYSTSEADQLRVLDYIAMDCRRATSAAVNTVTVNGVTENALILTLPPYYSSTNSSAAPNTPILSSGSVSYGSDIVTITYEQNGTNFTREVKVTDSSGTTVRSDNTTPIVKNVSTFTVTPSDLTTTVSCKITFSPSFTHNNPSVQGTTVSCNTFLRNAKARQ